jgi:hypothetical protein
MTEFVYAVHYGSGIKYTCGKRKWFVTFDRQCFWTFERLMEKTINIWRRDAVTNPTNLFSLS